ncbi:TIGR02556 family CRISPR-associated protein [Methanosalsum natronophilum]|uniref:TIGR02556 family CRISPR-associated protein n=1 Tax=Methanosalsum natronophilum TaxID=768733 RepID=UPI0021676CD4|nr:TIGR02556 family CRISPR-associated protein [Methanosalsum natronophilum]MCS3923884.1 CRISPR-associated protein Csh1 [Methanosalsum natronophilum]
MITTLKAIGEYSLQRSNIDLEKPINVLVENPNDNGYYKNVFVILIKHDVNSYIFQEVEHQEFSKERLDKYLYKKGSSKGPDLTPTAKLTEAHKTLTNKIIGWFNGVLTKSNSSLDEDEYSLLSSIKDVLANNFELIIEQLKELISGLDGNESAIVTIAINEDDQIKYVGDIDVFKKLLVSKSTSDLYDKYGVISKQENKTCSVCYQIADEVFGFSTPYKFYTVDKPGFVASGFDQSNAWQNNPVCLNCSLKVIAGKEYIEKYLKFNVYRLDYFIIPNILVKEGIEDIYSVFEDYSTIDVSLNKEYGNFLKTREDDLLYYLSDLENHLNIDLMFFAKSNAQFSIILHIKDILPSRLKHLFILKDEIDRKIIFKENISQNEIHPIEFSLNNVYTFFPSSREHPDNTKYFLEIMHSIFTGRPIDYKFLLKNILYHIRYKHKNEQSNRWHTLAGLQLLDYVYRLGILNGYKGNDNMDQQDISKLLEDADVDSTDSYEKRSNKIFNEFDDFFNMDAKKAIFLEGVLAQYLLNIQWQKRKSTPFKNKLRGLNLDERYVKRLLPEIQNKLDQYDANYYSGLETLISKYMIQSGNGWKLSNDEISFYFVLGMNLASYVKPQTSSQSDDQGEIDL